MKLVSQMEPKLTKGELTAARILEATTFCVATLGIEETSITRIAEKAGVSRGLVAHYFPEKSRMFLEVIRYIVERGYSRIDSPPKSTGPVERLIHVFKSNLEFFVAHPHYLKCFLLLYYFSSFDREYRDLNTTLNDRATERIRQGLVLCKIREEGFAEVLHSQLFGAIFKFYTTRHELTGKAYTARFVRGISAQIKERAR